MAGPFPARVERLAVVSADAVVPGDAVPSDDTVHDVACGVQVDEVVYFAVFPGDFVDQAVDGANDPLIYQEYRFWDLNRGEVLST